MAAERGARRRERIHRLAAHANGSLGRRRRAGERDREAGERFEQRGGRLVVVKRRLLQPVERRVVAGRPEVGAEVAPVPRLAPLAWRRVVVRARLPPLARLALAARVGRRLRHRREVAAVPRRRRRAARRPTRCGPATCVARGAAVPLPARPPRPSRRRGRATWTCRGGRASAAAGRLLGIKFGDAAEPVGDSRAKRPARGEGRGMVASGRFGHERVRERRDARCQSQF